MKNIHIFGDSFADPDYYGLIVDSENKRWYELLSQKYPNIEIIGYLNGYKGLLLGKSVKIPFSIKNKIANFYDFGGSPIGNSRVKLTNINDCVKKGYVQDGENPLEVAANQLVKDGITILHTIGGDDTNTTAADLSYYLKENDYQLTVVGLPKTIDNDVFPISQTLGAWTAAEQGALFFENIVKNNPEVDKLILFKKSQKFLDRILFILFAEDKNLIPTNAIPRIVESWALADDLHYKPLYELFKTFFIHLNVGYVYKSGYEIPAYGGGLFMPDEVLDNLKVDDEILKDDLLVLSKYDFNTDVDVNILGHIFEHSLSEIEETEAKLKGEQVDKSKGKRKKDGVFYTPKYITKYIVDNTVGKLCNEKKSVLELDQDFDIVEYQKSNGGVNKKGEKLFHNLESYKKWLLELKIVDPACGSGAFLNEALSFLIKEHKDIDDLT